MFQEPFGSLVGLFTHLNAFIMLNPHTYGNESWKFQFQKFLKMPKNVDLSSSMIPA